MAELKPFTVTTVELTAKQYAAIHLCIPDSGDADLDAMIRKAQRERKAELAINALFNRQYLDVPVCPKCRVANDDPGIQYAEIAYAYADALIAAGEVKHENHNSK